MPWLKTGCGSTSLRSNGFAIGVYSLSFYTIFLAVASFHLHLQDVHYSPVLSLLTVLLIVSFGLIVTASILLLIGICVDGKRLLLPWVVAICINTVQDIALCTYFLFEEETKFSLWITFLYISDLSFCLLNIYSVLVILSLYKEYRIMDNEHQMDSHKFQMILANGSSAINKLTPKELFDCELGVVQSEDGDNPSRMSCVSSASRSRANSCSVQDTCRITASVAANLNVSGVRREDRTAVTEREALSQ